MPPSQRNGREELEVTPWVQAEQALNPAGGDCHGPGVTLPCVPLSCPVHGDPEAGLPSVSGVPPCVPGSRSITLSLGSGCGRVAAVVGSMGCREQLYFRECWDRDSNQHLHSGEAGQTHTGPMTDADGPGEVSRL